jgi:hypothetical protein
MTSVEIDPQLVQRADANYQELYRLMARLSPDGAVVEDGELLLARTGPLLPFLNGATVLRPPADPEAALARAASFYAQAGQSWALITSDATSDVMEPVARAAGRTPRESPGMVLSPIGAPPSVPPGLLIEAVRDVGGLHRYNDTMTAGFGGEWARAAILDTGVLLGVPELTHYVGLLDGEPVATAMRFSSHRIAGVFNVSTVPEARRRGIGEAITWRAAVDGLAEGCIASALQASEMGFPIYQRMGYCQVLTYKVWLPE